MAFTVRTLGLLQPVISIACLLRTEFKGCLHMESNSNPFRIFLEKTYKSAEVWCFFDATHLPRFGVSLMLHIYP